ncbi:hypothetical protein QBC32DRAFT_354729 [Pseudoneurospora amorphoporcata]|uniref:MARVEL domain-containing protein n=1 Tax=Pseudoneurospora amorphoporcata TaxID=241081 RepID=A0AAN6NLI6_9PEZI|nr:hypothetical protein QBC32DRAFT_354729 [Pseudoneurospora amorphoporcata]
MSNLPGRGTCLTSPSCVSQIPTMGMLAYFVDGYVKANALTPTYILILFIVSVLALAWSIATLFSYHRSSTNAQFVSFVDLAFVGAFIAAVFYLRWIGSVNCTSVDRGNPYFVDLGAVGSANFNTFRINVNKTCAMLKACFAFGIMNCIFFFITSLLAWIHGAHTARSEKVYTTRKTTTHHHHHRGASGHRRSHSGSHSRSRRSRSHSRSYV